MLSRRKALKAIGGLAISLYADAKSVAAQFYGSFGGPSWVKVRREKTYTARLGENAFVEDGRSLVGVYGAIDAGEAVKGAVDLIGGVGKLGIKGKKVLVKPNVVSGRMSPTTTSPEVVGAVVKLLYGHGASRVYVGDMSALTTLSTSWNMSRTGIRDAAEKNGAEVVAFEDYGWVEVPLPGNEIIKAAFVTEWLYKVDLIVNLPVIKTHRSATYSIALKNFIGCTHLKQRPYLIDSSLWEEIIAEFNMAYGPEINIVDGTVSMIEGGPWEGTSARTNLVIASGDRVAADAVGLGVIKSFGRWRPVAGIDVWDQRQIKRAVALGVGKPKEGIRLLAGGGRGMEDFDVLMGKVRLHTGL